LIDTAGLRESSDEVEILGIDRSKELIDKADLVVLLTDPETLDAMCCHPDNAYAGKTLCVLNKTDLLGFEALPDDTGWDDYLKGSRFASKLDSTVQLIPCSTFLPDGISKLRQKIVSRISVPDLQPSSVLVTNTRHLAAIERSISSLASALEAISNSAGYEFIAFDLIEAVSSLSEITGAVTTDEMLDRIFSSFCIGK
jgi:tRNA modification GTPase